MESQSVFQVIFQSFCFYWIRPQVVKAHLVLSLWGANRTSSLDKGPNPRGFRNRGFIPLGSMAVQFTPRVPALYQFYLSHNACRYGWNFTTNLHDIIYFFEAGIWPANWSRLPDMHCMTPLFFYTSFSIAFIQRTKLTWIWWIESFYELWGFGSQ